MSLSIASILLHAFLLLTLLLLAAMVVSAATSSSIPVEVEHGDVNTTTTTTFTNSSATSSTDNNENWEMYFCFLCSGRDPLLIHHCPIYWDECHLICDDDMSTNTIVDAAVPMATTAPPAPPVPPSSSSLGSSSAHDDCYVMKLYMSGRYVIVEHRPCKYIAWCFLTCGGGELADRRNVIMGGGSTTTTAMPAATIQGSILPVELCGTQQQVNAPRAPPSAGVVVPAAGGAH